MSTIWLSPHIDARFGQLPREVLFTNVSYGTRIIAQDDSWEKLHKVQAEKAYQGGDPWIDRAKNAYLLESDTGMPWPDSILRLEAGLLTFLKKETGSDPDHEPTTESLLRLLDSAEEIFNERYMPTPHPSDSEFISIWNRNPHRLVAFAFEHMGTYIQRDVRPQPQDLDFELVTQFFDRPAMKFRYEQQFCMPYTTQRRAKMMVERMKPGSRVLVLGDDDLVSLALLRYSDDLRVDVLELDPDLVAFLKEKGGERMTVLEHNLRYGVPDEMKKAYDCVTTDPPYAEEGMRFFIGCAKASLADGPDSRLFLTTYPGLLENPDALWKDIEGQDLDILKTHEYFSRYVYNNSYRVNQLATLKERGCPLHPTSELLGFPFLYAHFFECTHKTGEQAS